MALPRHDRRRRLRQTRGFTLVELITAASLMTVMMVGVVQIFAIITEAAGQAQGNAYAMEQGRALMDSIHRDIRGFDRLGYMRIQRSDINDTGTASTYTRPIPPTTRPKPGVPIFNGTGNIITWYSSDCLALTSVNYWEGQMGGTSPRKSTGAEVVYTSNIKTPTNRFEVASTPVGPRRGLLARGVWVVGGSTTAGTGMNSSDGSAASVISDLGTAKKQSRLEVSDGTDAACAVSPMSLTPLSTASNTGWAQANESSSGTTWQLRRVAACCLSEFLVETLEVTTLTPPLQWTRRSWTVKPIAFGGSTDKQAPLAIRVTIAIHDPSDKKPSTGTSGRFEGYALQETFWVSDP
ncbi:MAG: hypothetical protein NT049_15510 [Planctomycetota bacterium]|nr:hypothetical protein [Planctomycetota bacterium]